MKTKTSFIVCAVLLTVIIVVVCLFPSLQKDSDNGNTPPPSDSSIGIEFSETSNSSSEDSFGDTSDNVSNEPSDNSGDTTDPSIDTSEDNSSSSDISGETSEPTDESSAPNGESSEPSDGDDDASDNDNSSPGISSGSEGKDDDNSSNPSEEDDTSEEDNGSSGGSNSEKPVVHGDTPVVVTINGTEYVLGSVEEAKEAVSVEILETMEEGETLTFDDGYIVASNGAGTFTDSDGYTWTASQVSNMFLNQWCRKCGTRVGDGTNGTCVRYTRDKECPLCGEDCKKLACHTCDE